MSPIKYRIEVYLIRYSCKFIAYRKARSNDSVELDELLPAVSVSSLLATFIILSSNFSKEEVADRRRDLTTLLLVTASLIFLKAVRIGPFVASVVSYPALLL